MPRSGELSRMKHFIAVMQENHSFDNHFGVLPYAVGSPYRSGPCEAAITRASTARSTSALPMLRPLMGGREVVMLD